MTLDKWAELRQSMRDLMRNAVDEPVPAPAPTPVVSDRTRFLYMTGLFVLAFTLGLIIFMKSYGGNATAAPIIIETAPKVSSMPPIKVQTEPAQDDLRRKVEIMDKKLALLGCVSNNNWHTLANGLPADDLVYFKEDWRLSQFPPHVRPDSEQTKDFLRQWSQ